MSKIEKDPLRMQLSSIDQRLRTIIPSEYISLVPLTTNHALAYFNHYQLNDIQQMTDLPRFANVSEVCEWIKEETAVKNSYNFAIELPVTGFAGVVNLTVSEYAAFFGIWLGEKFQGLGLGTQTGQLICHHALQVGLSVIFTAAFLTNRRSILMLKKVGFDTLPISAYAPHDDRAFFILTHDLAIKQNGNIELMNYCREKIYPTVFTKSVQNSQVTQNPLQINFSFKGYKFPFPLQTSWKPIGASNISPYEMGACMPKPLRKAAQYVRMSTDMQQYSTLNQQALIAQYANDHGIEIIKTYIDEGRSGLRLAGRDALQSLIADVTSGQAEYELILVYDVSRWGRFQDTDESAHYEFICRRAGKSIIYCAEQFTNDGSPMASIVKGLKRVMAGEYSRELSSKVFLGQSRLAALGHHVGAPSPYGLRRVMFDTTGKARTQLEYGQRKYIHSDKVFLRPGPQEEIDVVRLIFKWFLEDKIYYETIAKRLKAMRVPPPKPHPAWNKPIIRGMLKNEKYLGHMIYNRYTERLRSPKKKNPISEWVRHDNAFEGIIDETTFRLVQEKIAKNIRVHSDEALLDHLKKIYKVHGRISTSLIIGTKDTPAPSSYRRAFGSMERAYIEIGYNVTQNGKDHRSKKIITQKESCAITNRLLVELKFLGCNAQLVGKVNIRINRKWVVMIAAMSQTKAHPGDRMFLRGKIDAILAYKPNATDPEPNYYLIPCSVIPGSTLYINNPQRREWFKQWRVQWENLPASLIELARALKPTEND